MDDKRRSIGLKRDALVQTAKGKYLCFVDDDDDVAAAYVDTLLKLSESNADVLCFRSLLRMGAESRIVDFSIYNENEQVSSAKIVRRRPFPVCAFKTEMARRVRFKDVNYSEDWDWSKRVLKTVKTEAKTRKVLHIYNHGSSAASGVETEVNKGGHKIKGKLQILK